MLTLFRNHLKSCPHAHDGRKWKRCRCPVWIEGSIEGKPVRRRSLDTSSWERGNDIARSSELAGELTTEEPIRIAEAQAKFKADAIARGLAHSTLKKYRVLFDQMDKFIKLKGINAVSEFDLSLLREFRESWADAPLSAGKKLERLKSFMRFCIESGWSKEKRVLKIKAPKVTQFPTLPLEKEEISAILKACRTHKETALILLLRFSGLRIEDASTLARDRVKDGKLFLYTQKTGVPVWVPLPPVLLDALAAVENASAGYFFWTGVGLPETQAGNMRRMLRKLFRRAGVPDAHPHRFRDTFAVELLLAGVRIERVSVLLGHSSIKVTEKSYSPWVLARQEQLEADVARTWGPAETGRTPPLS